MWIRVTAATLLVLAGCAAPPRVRVLSFNVLQGAGDASNVGFDDADFEGGRCAAVARVILESGADVVGVQEDASGDDLVQALGEGWQRAGNVYARLPLTLVEQQGLLTVARVQVDRRRSFVLVNVHWRPSPYGPYLLRDRLLEAEASAEPVDRVALVREVGRASAKPDGARGWRETLDAVRPHLERGERVVVTGDFNEPSALDWQPPSVLPVARPEAPPGQFCTTLGLFRMDVIEAPWQGSRLLGDLGLCDAYRVARPDVERAPGHTWTPPYPAHTPGRRPPEEQVHDRIDWILVGPRLKVEDCWIVGEEGGPAERALAGPWPSDHRAVLAELSLR